MQTWISKAIFRQQDLEACISKVVQLAAAAETGQDLFTLTAQQAAQYLRAEQITSQRWLITLNNGQEFVVSKRQARNVRDVLSW